MGAASPMPVSQVQAGKNNRAWIAFAGVAILLVVIGIAWRGHHGWNAADHLHKHTPWCPGDGRATWEIRQDKTDSEVVALAQRLLAERGWMEIRVQDFGHASPPTDTRLHTVHYVTISARCNPENA